MMNDKQPSHKLWSGGTGSMLPQYLVEAKADFLPTVQVDENGTTAVPDAALQAALTAYENARMDGLCHEGAWESALDVLRTFGLESMIGDEELLDQIRHQIRNR